MTAATSAAATVTRQDLRLRPDPSRVVAQLFVAGPRARAGEARARASERRRPRSSPSTTTRCSASLAELVERFGDRHRDLVGTFSHHADRIGNRLPIRRRAQRGALAAARRHLHPRVRRRGRGAVQPRMVATPTSVGPRRRTSGRAERPPDRRGPPLVDRLPHRHGVRDPDSWSWTTRTRSQPWAPSVRGGSTGSFPGPAAGARPRRREHLLRARPSRRHVHHRRARRAARPPQGPARHPPQRPGDRHPASRDRRRVAIRRTFPNTRTCPNGCWGPPRRKSHGMEDARFVRFVDEGTASYLATYTADHGVDVRQQLLRTVPRYNLGAR